MAEMVMAFKWMGQERGTGKEGPEFRQQQRLICLCYAMRQGCANGTFCLYFLNVEIIQDSEESLIWCHCIGSLSLYICPFPSPESAQCALIEELEALIQILVAVAMEKAVGKATHDWSSLLFYWKVLFILVSSNVSHQFQAPLILIFLSCVCMHELRLMSRCTCWGQDSLGVVLSWCIVGSGDWTLVSRSVHYSSSPCWAISLAQAII